MFAFPSNPVNFARMSPKEYEQEVQPHLAFDIKDMDALRRQGKPISAANLSADYFDGQDGRVVPLDPTEKRGVDINDAWNLTKDTQAKLSKAKVRKADIGIVNDGNIS